MFSRDSEKLGTEKVGTFFIAVEEKAPTVAFILLGVLTLLLEESVKGSKHYWIETSEWWYS